MATAPVRRLDPTWDMTFGKGLANYCTGAEAAGQRVVSRLRMILGEWYLDVLKYIPWFQPEDSNTKPVMGGSGPPDLGYAEALAKALILGTDGIEAIKSFTMSFNKTTRQLVIACKAVSVDGDDVNIRTVIG